MEGSKWTGNGNNITTETYISEFDLNISITVTYQIINKMLSKRGIDLSQSGMPSLAHYTIGK
jgi:hypothetical protein